MKKSVQQKQWEKCLREAKRRVTASRKKYPGCEGAINGLGGLAEGVIGLTGGAPKPAVPGARGISNTFNALLHTYLNAQPDIFDAQNTYQPKYAGLDVDLLSKYLPQLSTLFSNANTAAAQGNTNTVSTLGPSAATAWRNTYDALNPNTTSLLDKLTSTANTELEAGSRLDPATLSSITSNVRSDWSSRGLGDSMPAAFNEALSEASGGQNLLNQRIGNASSVANLNSNVNNSLLAPVTASLLENSQTPAAGLGLVTGAGPSIVSPSQSSDFLNTGFNARAASNISQANNQAALLGGFGNFD